MIKLLIVDDHGLIRKGLHFILDEIRDIRIVGEAGTGEEALIVARNILVDVVILDILMPGRGGLDIIKDLKRDNPRIKVIILTTYEPKQYAIQCFRAGAEAFICKSYADDQLIPAIRAVVADGYYVTEETARCMADYINERTPSQGHEQLSQREFQTLIRMGKGQTIKEIAQDLALSEKTVSTYRSRIIKKMGFISTVDIIRYTIDHRLIL
jgi:two-component system, NarL family, invasion response regulator UvrY